ncbi:lysozyme [Arthrobacter sp. zg-ZUI100]|nr:GH25 family lysozyme [Arthrobacter jiangjiafuii]MBP3034796.1 lysozyme [Arthrobacter jiangjiafuii]
MAGPLGAKMGQGLERLLETGDPQIPTEDEVIERLEAETRPEIPQDVPDLAANVVSPAAAANTGDVASSFTAVAKAHTGPSVIELAATWMPNGVQGLDVSSHQNNVDWLSAWNQGGRFAYVKATEGEYYKNPFYTQQYNGSANVGMVRGAYHFAIPTPGSAVAEANYFVNNGGGWSPDGRTLPPLLDIEYNPYPQLGNTCYDMTASEMVTWIKQFSATMKSRTGRVPMIYTTTDWWRTCTGNSSAFADHPLHIASYSQAGPGALPAGWGTYDVWQYSSTGPFVGDSNVWRGTIASLREFAVRSGSGPSISSSGDVVAVGPDGSLLNYRSNGAGGLLAPARIGSGWSGTLSVHSMDWNADNIFDLLSQDAAGNLNVYYGQASGGFSGPTTVGSGWDQLRITVGKWDPAAAYPGIVASDSRGRGLYYPNTRGGALVSPAVALGTGFEKTLATIMDFSGDGVPEVIMRKANGDLVSRQRAGDGSAGPAKTIGVGWQDAVALRSVSGFSGGNSSGILSIFADGGLRYYASNMRGAWGPSSVIGEGWGPYLLANTQSLNTPPGPSIASAADIVALDAGGNLLTYRPTESGRLEGPTRIGEGFHQVKSIQSLDFTGDGIMDVVVQWAKGTVDVYAGKKQGGFAAARTVGTAGWGDLTVYPDTLASPSGLPGLLTRDADGTLRRYTNPDGYQLQGGAVIGQGWNGFKLAVLDWNGDGFADVLGIHPDGKMSYYKRNSTGAFAPQAPETVGTGWNTFNSVTAGHGVTGVGGNSVVAVGKNGSLYNYQVSGTGSWAAVSILGTGWGGLTLAGSN